MGDRPALPIYRRESRSISPRPPGISLRLFPGLLPAFRASRPHAAWAAWPRYGRFVPRLSRPRNTFAPHPPRDGGACFPFRPGWLRRSPHVALLGEVVRASATVLFASASTISVALRTVWGAGWFAERRVRRSLAHCRGSLDRVDTRGEQRQIGVGVGWEVCGGGGGMGRVPREAPAFVVCLTAVRLPVVFRSPRRRARLNPGSGAPADALPTGPSTAIHRRGGRS
jgi:hypothetical protein